MQAVVRTVLTGCRLQAVPQHGIRDPVEAMVNPDIIFMWRHLPVTLTQIKKLGNYHISINSIKLLINKYNNTNIILL